MGKRIMSGYLSSQSSYRQYGLSLTCSDKIQKVDHIDCKQSGLLEHGLCEVELFVSTQSFATDDVDWGICSVESKDKV
jgi:hypothetical protein